MHYIPPPPPQTTAIFRDFKKSTAMCKVHNVGVRYIKKDYLVRNIVFVHPRILIETLLCKNLRQELSIMHNILKCIEVKGARDV